MQRTVHVLAALLLTGLLAPGMSGAGVEPDPSDYQVWSDAPAGMPVTLLVVPDGSGALLTAAKGPGGVTVDATIHLRIQDPLGHPIVNLPRDDMWLGAVDGGLAVCALGSIADRATDTNGETVWTQRLRAGGWSTAGCQVYLNGMELAGPAGLNLRFVSPDIDGSLRVDLVDVVPFATDYFGAYRFRSDFNGDGVVNLSDFIFMVPAIGRSCP